MKKLIKLMMLALMVSPMVLGSSIALAKNTGTPNGFSKGGKNGWQGGTAPRGWSHGNKKGWKGGTSPYGLAKKVVVEDPLIE